MKKKLDIPVETPSRSRRERNLRTAPADRSKAGLPRDAASEAERKWFEENKSLDPLALFAKYYQRLS